MNNSATADHPIIHQDKTTKRWNAIVVIHHQRRARLAPRARAHLGSLGDQLIQALVHEAHELDLGDGLEPGQRHAESRPDDGGFRKRRIEYTVGAEPTLQPVCRPEHTAELPDILAHDQHALIVTERLLKCRVDRLHHHCLSHALSSCGNLNVGLESWRRPRFRFPDGPIDPRQRVVSRLSLVGVVPQPAPLEIAPEPR